MKILIIGDEARILTAVKRRLEAEGHSIDGVDDGNKGLRRASLVTTTSLSLTSTRQDLTATTF